MHKKLALSIVASAFLTISAQAQHVLPDQKNSSNTEPEELVMCQSKKTGRAGMCLKGRTLDEENALAEAAKKEPVYVTCIHKKTGRASMCLKGESLD